MIGFVEVDIDKIKKAYNLIKNSDDDDVTTHVNSKKLRRISDIVNDTERGSSIFSRKEQIKVKKLLQELVYSSFISSSEYMILRVEVASLIQDIVYHYGEDSKTGQQPDVDWKD